MAIAAQKFACRPSRLVLLRDPVLALDFDLAAAARLLEIERHAKASLEESLGESAANSRDERDVYW